MYLANRTIVSGYRHVLGLLRCCANGFTCGDLQLVVKNPNCAPNVCRDAKRRSVEGMPGGMNRKVLFTSPDKISMGRKLFSLIRLGNGAKEAAN